MVRDVTYRLGSARPSMIIWRPRRMYSVHRPKSSIWTWRRHEHWIITLHGSATSGTVLLESRLNIVVFIGFRKGKLKKEITELLLQSLLNTIFFKIWDLTHWTWKMVATNFWFQFNYAFINVIVTQRVVLGVNKLLVLTIKTKTCDLRIIS